METKADFLQEYQSLASAFKAMKPEMELTLRDSAMDVEGYVVVWNTGICKGGPFDKNGVGCGKGGTRIMPTLAIEDIKRLARSMAEKMGAAGLPLGGAKSGLMLDPNDAEYEKKFRRFVKLVQDAGVLAEDGGIFGGFGYDVGNKPPYNAIWACDELGTLKSFTGKPVEMGGTDYDREGIAGLGVAVAARAAMEHRKTSPAGASFAVQGIGAMGAAVIRYFSSYGGVLKSLSDPKLGGTWVLRDKISEALMEAIIKMDFATSQKLISSEADKISDQTDAVLYQEVDVLFPCALEDVLRGDNAAKVCAKYISEGANNPTTDEAHEILYSKGITLVPDIIANPGGIIAAYVEMSSSVPAEENAKTRANVLAAKKMTEEKVAANVKELLTISDRYQVATNLVGDYMAWRNILKK